MFKNPYIYLFNQLNFAIRRQNYYFILRFTQRNLPLLRHLRQLNVIRRFYYLNPNLLKVFPSYNLRSPRHLIKTYYRMRSRIVLRLSTLRLLRRSLGNSILLLETHKGLITHKEALRLGIGGVLVCRLG